MSYQKSERELSSLVDQNESVVKVIFYTLLALIAFAANSVLCRMALEMLSNGPAIDAGSFTIIRLVSGIIMLLIVLWLQNIRSKRQLRKKKKPYLAQAKGSWLGAAMLFLYAFGFSYAYVFLQTGSGALILFGVVQMTMISMSIFLGNKLRFIELLGLILAFSGFVYLVLPGVSAPSLQGLVLMCLAGVAWGGYTLIGQGSKDPLQDTAFNFIRTIPFIMMLMVYNLGDYYVTEKGVYLAIASGAVTSALGYAIWYAALTYLKTMQAAVLQLSVPVIAAMGGVFFVDEPLTNRLMLSSVFILGGILLVILAKNKKYSKNS